MFPPEYNEYMKKTGIHFRCGECTFWKSTMMPPMPVFSNENILCERTKYFNYSPHGFFIDKKELLKDIFKVEFYKHFYEYIENTKKLIEYDNSNIDYLFRISTNVIEAIKNNRDNRGDINNKHTFTFTVKFLVIKQKFVVVFIDEFSRTEYGKNYTTGWGYSYCYAPKLNINRIKGKKSIGMKDTYTIPKKKHQDTIFNNIEIDNYIKKSKMIYDSHHLNQDGTLTITFKPREKKNV